MPDRRAVGEPDSVGAPESFALTNVDSRDGSRLRRARVDDNRDGSCAEHREALGQVDRARDEHRFAGAKGVQLSEFVPGITQEGALATSRAVLLVGRRPREEVGEPHRTDGHTAVLTADRGEVLTGLRLDRSRERKRVVLLRHDDGEDECHDGADDDQNQQDAPHARIFLLVHAVTVILKSQFGHWCSPSLGHMDYQGYTEIQFPYIV